jgi:DNA-binding NarL/FixJ family response regulator
LNFVPYVGALRTNGASGATGYRYRPQASTQKGLVVVAATPTKIVIADDHPLFRDALRRTLGAQSDFEVVAEAADGQEALELCRKFEPELVLMDLHMPRMDGVRATQAIKRVLPQAIVLVLTAFENPDYLLEALKAGPRVTS